MSGKLCCLASMLRANQRYTSILRLGSWSTQSVYVLNMNYDTCADSDQWDLTQPILMHFTPTHLMVLSDEGVYRLYDISNPQSYQQYTMGNEISELGIISAKGFDDGFVVLTGGLQFVEIRGWKGGRTGNFANSGMSELSSRVC
jgi:hypothetical protein